MDKLNILAASKDEATLAPITAVLESEERLSVTSVHSAEETLQELQKKKFDVVIASEALRDTTGLDLINRVVEINPFINTALASPLSPGDFHEATEGLGIFMQLPVNPGPESAKEMLQLLDKIYQL